MQTVLFYIHCSSSFLSALESPLASVVSNENVLSFKPFLPYVVSLLCFIYMYMLYMYICLHIYALYICFMMAGWHHRLDGRESQ